jgi:hypothetical protein
MILSAPNAFLEQAFWAKIGQNGKLLGLSLGVRNGVLL